MSLKEKSRISASLSDLKIKTLWLLFGSSLKNQQLEINKNKMSFPKKDSKPECYLT